MLKVSIIIPYYRKKNYIKKTLSSILRQTFKNFEILIIYDDTEKSELDFIKNLVKIDKRIKLIINKKNLGAGLSRNKGILKAKGKYISFIDADDLWKKDKLKLQLKFMEDNKYLVSHTSYVIATPNNKVLEFRRAKNFRYLNDLLYSCDIGLSTVMITSKLLKTAKFPSLRTKEDYLLWLRLSKNNTRMLGYNKTLARWRITDNSLSSSSIQKLKDAFQIYNKYLKFSFIKSLFNVLVLSLNFLIKRHL